MGGSYVFDFQALQLLAEGVLGFLAQFSPLLRELGPEGSAPTAFGYILPFVHAVSR